MIDRYYEAMDLNNTTIYIEWETPKGKNGGTKSISEHYLKIIDDENYPGKLIFGWAISEAITKASGVLKFAVRFIQRDENKKIAYSFNTLTAQVNILPSLGLDLENDSYEIDNNNQRLLERIEYSEVVGTVQALAPYFLTGLKLLDEDDEKNGNNEYDLNADGKYELQVIATSNDYGAITYRWERADLNDDNEIVLDQNKVDYKSVDSANYQVKKVQITPEEIEAWGNLNGAGQEDDHHHVFYRKNGENYTLIGQEEYATALDPEVDTNIYEDRACLTVDKYGAYRAIARNRIFNSMNSEVGAVAMFKRPEAVEINDSEIKGKEHFITDREGYDKSNIFDFNDLINDDLPGSLTFEWERKNEDGEFSTCNEDDVKKNDEDGTFTINKPGVYRLKVIRTRNGMTTY
jgi:hypothetical protein